ncbi:MAG: glycosyltransferase family 4 protein [Endomicrobium sp.]|jgi:glycosyltransferase involved in cell wall biosynthesis|nr:glycosyltransferase family 4 protein [Endomicrobium sp.]
MSGNKERIKEKKKTLYLVFNHFEKEHLGKDVFLVPYYLGKIYGFDVNIVYPKTKTNAYMPKEIRGVKLIPLKNIFAFLPSKLLKELVFLFYVIKHAKSIDILMRFHLSRETVLIGTVYKWLNPKGFLYVKGDGGRRFLKPSFGGFKHILKRFICKNFLHNVDLISTETKKNYEEFLNTDLLGIDISAKLRLMYNGFDADLMKEFAVNKKTFAQKENLIITVGRLGTEEKNTQMLLDAASGLDMKNYKIALIGPVDARFQTYIDNFYAKNPHLQDKVVFTGAVYDKAELWAWYNKSKVFILTSLYEGFANVFAEAVNFENYLISTEVSGVKEMTGVSGYGEIIPQNDTARLRLLLQQIINGETDLESLYDKINWNNIDVSWGKFIKEAALGMADPKKETQ